MDEEQVFNRIKEKFVKKFGLEQWIKEEPAIRKIYQELVNQFRSNNAKFVDCLGCGTSGIVLLLSDDNMKDIKGNPTKKALKFARPLDGNLDNANLTCIKDEAVKLASIRHNSIISIENANTVTVDNKDIPWYIMPAIENSESLQDFLQAPSTDIHIINIITLMLDIADALQTLHSHGIVHSDVKEENILIVKNNPPKALLTDLGYARIMENVNESIKIRYTRGYAPPEVEGKTEKGYAPGAMVAKIPKSVLNIDFDLYSFGITLLLVRKYIQDRSKQQPKLNLLPKYYDRYLRLIIGRLVKDHLPPICKFDKELGIENTLYQGLENNRFKEIAYKNFEEVADDLKKFLGLIEIENLIPEINNFNDNVISQSSNETKTPLTQRVEKVLDSKRFSSLSGTSQLGLLNFVYPSSTHSRMEHALGTFTNVCDYIKTLFRNKRDPFFRSIMTKGDLDALLLSALLHDIGYYPLSHDLEDCQEWINSKISHEQYSYDIIATDDELRYIIKEYWKVEADEIHGILANKPATMKHALLHSIINGPIDADKMDYLIRDAQHLNLPYPFGFDRNWFLRNLAIDYDKQMQICVTAKGRISAESFAFARYCMFTVAYWHHTYRSVKAMLRYIISRSSTGKFEIVDHKDFVSKLSKNYAMTANYEKDMITVIEEAKQSSNKNDLAQLMWIYQKIDTAGKTVLKMMLQRKLYKRILVIDPNDPADEDLYDWFKDNKKEFKTLDEIRENFERTILTKLGNKLPQNFDKTIPIILIDIPFIKTPGNLRYIREGGNCVEFAKSSLWKAIEDNFSQSIGMVRFFANPDIHHIIENNLPIDELRSIARAIVSEIKNRG